MFEDASALLFACSPEINADEAGFSTLNFGASSRLPPVGDHGRTGCSHPTDSSGPSAAFDLHSICHHVAAVHNFVPVSISRRSSAVISSSSGSGSSSSGSSAESLQIRAFGHGQPGTPQPEQTSLLHAVSGREHTTEQRVQDGRVARAKVASFTVDGCELICLPQAFDLFLKHLVGGLHTVYTKLKRLEITPVVCNVEQVRILRGLGAIQPGVNRCKLISRKDFETLYNDCTNARSVRVGMLWMGLVRKSAPKRETTKYCQFFTLVTTGL
ncbi:hypothetical protein WMY93_028541 [Mugilogobius chulae]|uniref:SKI/SNO/DAC domain-containing protein n=1 Tax=Mugilogobius chulae TaxID=88201 RepID=A0AAW0MNK4_9GOBI